jgi:NTP-dependent ternary system trypsin peptidase co-occuring protein
MNKPRRAGQTAEGLLIEVRPDATNGDLGSHKTIPEEFRSRSAEIFASISEVVKQFRSRIEKELPEKKASSWNVESIEIEFGLTLQAEAGVVIAKTTAGATFSARLVLHAPEKG